MATFGRDHFYALDDRMRLDRDRLARWLEEHAGSSILMFGFTFIVWEHLLSALRPGELNLQDAILIHSGGWKKLADRAVTSREFKVELERVTGLRRVHNFYGMAEQIGTVLVECEQGYLHTPNAAELIVRDPGSWEVVADGEVGRRTDAERAARELSRAFHPHRGSRARRSRRQLSLRSSWQGGLDPRTGSRGRASRLRRHELRARGAGRVIVERLVPRSAPVEVSELLRSLREAPRDRADPFHPARIEFSAAVSRAIFDHPPAEGLPGAARRGLLAAPRRSLAAGAAVLGPGGDRVATRSSGTRVPPATDERRHDVHVPADRLVPGGQPQRRARLAHPVRAHRSSCCARCSMGCWRRSALPGSVEELAVISYDHEAEPTAAALARGRRAPALGRRSDRRSAARRSDPSCRRTS